MPVAGYEWDQASLSRWFDVAERLATKEIGFPANARYRQTFATKFWPLAERIEQFLGSSRNRWDEAVSDAIVEHSLRVARDASGSLGFKEGASHLTMVRALRIAHALVAHRPDLIGKADARWAAEMIGRDGRFEAEWRMLAMRAHPPQAKVDSPCQAIPFVVPFAPPVPRGGTHVPAMRASGSLHVPVVPTDDAPVVAVLEPSAPNAAPIQVREVDGRLYRPVLAPGSWDQLDLVGFAEALEGRSGWRDDPLRVRSDDRMPVLSVLESTLSVGKASPGVQASAQAAVDMALGRAASLIVVGGIVHVETEPPRMALIHVSDRTGSRVGRVETGWAMGSLRSWLPQEPVNLERSVGSDCYDIFEGLPVPVLDAADHREMATAWRAALGDGRHLYGSGAVHVVTTSVARVSMVDHAGPGQDPEAFLTALAGYQDHGRVSEAKAVADLVGSMLAGDEASIEGAPPTTSATEGFLRAVALVAVRRKLALEAEMDGLGRFGP